MSYPMLTLEDALGRILEGLGETEAEDVLLADALGRSPMVRRLIAAGDVPPFDNSAMDGYAVLASDGAGARRVTGESRAGAASVPRVEPGTAVKVMTGAPMPAGSDAVVPIEEAEERGSELVLAAAPAGGAHVRAAGHDVRAGAEVALPDAALSPATIGLLAALGIGSVAVHRRPRVAILSTGDELVDAGSPLGPGQIHDANGPALSAAASEIGAEPVLLERAADDPAIIEERLRDGARRADLLLVSGGVSVGRHDHVRSAIERLGTLDFWRIAVQPGKPLAFGRIGERPIIGLPGNPVSALVTFELFVRPALRHMQGLTGDGRPRVRASVQEELRSDPSRRAFVRVRVEALSDGYRATSAGGQASSQLLPLAVANGLLVVPEGVAATVPGSTYEVIVTGVLA